MNYERGPELSADSGERFVVRFVPRSSPDDSLPRKVFLKAANIFGLGEQVIGEEGLPYDEAERLRGEAELRLETEGRVGEVRIEKRIPPETNFG